LTSQPPGSGWNGRDQSDWYSGPLYSDTGWHLDLSEPRDAVSADPGLSTPGQPGYEPDQPSGPAVAGDSPFRYEQPFAGNGEHSAHPRDRRADDIGRPDRTGGPDDRRAGRHARQAGAGPDLAPDYPASSSPLAQYSHPVAGREERPADYPESTSPLARYSHPDPVTYRDYPEPSDGQDYRLPIGAEAALAPPVPTPAPPRPDLQPLVPQPLATQPQRPDPVPPNPTLALSIMPAPYASEASPADPLPGEITGIGAISVVRSSGVMAVGTLGSRATGVLRTTAQSVALGALPVARAYNLSNTLPNVVYNLALGGILTSVIVPLIVNAKRREADGGQAYEQRMFTLVTALLFGITVIATLAAVPIVDLYSGRAVTGNVHHLAVIFAFFFIPQIFFYGVSSLIGAVLNSRGSFAAPMWTPIVNNVVVIGVLGLFIAVVGLHKNVVTVSGGDLVLLGLGTTLGIVAQTAALLPALRKAGFRWQPRTDFHRAEVTEIGRMAAWMFCYIGATQVAFLVTTKIANNYGPGYTYYQYAWLLFQLPYAVVGISVITALLPRMSAHAAESRLALVREDFSTGIRLSAAIVVPSSLVLAVLGPALAILVLAYGRMTPPQGHDIGIVFAVFCLGLLPYMIFQLQLRVFYALHDSKTPALIGLATMSVNIAANEVASHILPPAHLIAGLGVGFGLANLLGMIVSWRILSRRMHGLDGPAISSSVGRMYAATVPAALLALFVSLLVHNIVSGPHVAAVLILVLGGGGALLVYVLFARSLRVVELTGLSRSALSRLGR
jgi:putative peptidoglycan lipid II flippase